MNPLNLDPTRTLTLRRSFHRGTRKAFRALVASITRLIVSEDAFDLGRGGGVGRFPVPDTNDGARPVGNESYSYRSTQVNIKDPPVLEEIQKLQDRIALDDVVKYETEPHITVRHGLHDYKDTPERVRALLGGVGTVKATIAGLGVFEGTKNGDVLIFRIDSPDLKGLNELLGRLPNTQTHEYRPHITVAYLKPGTALKYVRPTSVDWQTMLFDTVLVSDTEGRKEPVDLLRPPLTFNKRWAYRSQDEAAAEFEKWLRRQVDKELLSPSEAGRWRLYIKRGVEKGANRAFNDVKRGKGRGAKATRFLDPLRSEGFAEGQREAFLRTALGRSTAIEKLRLLQNNALSEVRGMADDLVSRGRRVVVDGLVRNRTPKEIAKGLESALRISEARARTIANTELVKAHAEAQLQTMEELGVSEVGVAVEWSSLKSACPLCQPLDGIVLKIQEARGMIPRHPNCKCAWTVANVGETKDEKKGQKRSKTKIDKAVKRSQREGSDSDSWKPAVSISKDRPTTNEECGCPEHVLTFAKLMARLTRT